MRSAGRRLILLAALAGAAGCFHYVPIDELPARGTPVRVGLSTPIPVRLREITANNVAEVRGEVVSGEGGRIVLSAFGLSSLGGYEYLGRGETVVVPREVVASVEERRISVLRTVLGGAVLGALGYLVQASLSGAIGGGEGRDGAGETR